MGVRDWFVVGTRLFGLWVLWTGFSFLSIAVEHKLDIEQPREHNHGFGTCVIQVIWHLVFAWFLLAKAEGFAAFLFDGPPPPNAADKAEQSGESES